MTVFNLITFGIYWSFCYGVMLYELDLPIWVCVFTAPIVAPIVLFVRLGRAAHIHVSRWNKL